MGTWEHRVITLVCSRCVPSVFPVSGNTKQGREWRNKGLYREKTKCVPNVLTFFLYIALRAFFSLVKFYFFVGTVGTVGTWRHYAIAVGTFLAFLGTQSGNTGTSSGNISVGTREHRVGTFQWEHGNIEWEHFSGNMGTSSGNIIF